MDILGSSQVQAIDNKGVADALHGDCTEMTGIEPQVVKPKTASQTDSKPIKTKQRGGKRPGAGRRPNLAKQLLKGFTPATIAIAVQDMDVREVIMGLLKSKSERVRLETLAFLRDTLYGWPAQNLSLSGGVNGEHGRLAPAGEPVRPGNTAARFNHKET